MLLNDHLAKGLCDIIDEIVRDTYNRNVPPDEYGATSKRSTDFATHAVRTVLQLCRAMSLSYMVLFIDLVKAFDCVIREVVLGFPAHSSEASQRSYLACLRVRWIGLLNSCPCTGA